MGNENNIYQSGMFIKATEADEDRFAPLPIMLIEDDVFAKLSPMSLIVYAELKNRLFLSRMNGWKDEYGNAVIIFSQEEMSQRIHKSVDTVKRVYRELKEHHLISVRKRGKDRAAYIYLARPSVAKAMLEVEKKQAEHDGGTKEAGSATFRQGVESVTLADGKGGKNSTLKSGKVEEIPRSYIDMQQSNLMQQSNIHATPKEKAPTLDMVIQYAQEKGNRREMAEEFFFYWDSMNWTRKNGRRIQKWKSAFAQWALNDTRRGGGNTWGRRTEKRPGEYDEEFFDNLLKSNEEKVRNNGR